MKSIKGTMTCVPADVATTVEALPRKLNDVDVVHVELKKHVDHKTVYAKENIRPAVVQRAWECLTEGELYRKEGISAVFNSFSPNDVYIRHLCDTSVCPTTYIYVRSSARVFSSQKCARKIGVYEKFFCVILIFL